MSYKVAEKTSVKALAEVYLRDDMSDDYIYDQYLGLVHTVGNGFQVMGYAYRLSSEKPDAGWSTSWSAVSGASYQFNIPELCTVKLQDRFYYQVDPEWKWDHHRPRIYLTRKIGPVMLTLSDEIRLDLTGDRADDFYQNRAQAMVSKEITESLSLGLGYVWQSDRVAGEWKSFNVMQTVVAYAF